jgi:hypothetical protein
VKIIACSEDRAVGVVVPDPDEMGESIGTFEVKAIRNALQLAEDLGYPTVEIGWVTDNVTRGTNLTVVGVPKTWDPLQVLDGKIAVAPATVAEVDD